jgi:hypothetical protein
MLLIVQSLRTQTAAKGLVKPSIILATRSGVSWLVNAAQPQSIGQSQPCHFEPSKLSDHYTPPFSQISHARSIHFAPAYCHTKLTESVCEREEMQWKAAIAPRTDTVDPNAHQKEKIPI